MNLLVLSINYSPEPTGFAPHVTDLCEYLASKRHNVTVLTGFPFAPYWRRYAGYGGKVVKFETVNDVQLVRLAHFIPRKPSSVLQRICMEGTFCVVAGLMLLRLGRSDFDSVLYIGAQPSLAMLARIIGAMKKIPYAVAINDLAAQAAMESGLAMAAPLKGILSKFEYSAYRKATGAIVLCKGFRDALLENGFSERKIKIIHSPIDIDNIHPSIERDLSRETYGIERASFVVLWAGSMGAKQGLSNIIEASKLSRERGVLVLWVLVGDGEARGSLEAEIKKSHLEPNMRLLSFQSEDHLSDMFSIADVLLLNQLAAVRNTVIPSKLLTYMAAGLPVLAAVNPDGQAAALLRASEGGVIVEPENPGSLIEGLKVLMNDKKMRDEMGRKNRAYAVEHFDKRKILILQEVFLQNISSGVNGDQR